MMKKYSTILLICCATLWGCSNVFAQKTIKDKTFGFSFYGNFELPNFNFEDLNKELLNNGMLMVAEPNMAFGMGYQMQFGRSVFSFSSASCVGNTESLSATWTLEFSSFCFDYGYDLLNNPEVSLYPFAAFKNNTLALKYYEKIEETNLINYLGSDLKERNLSNNRAYLTLGAGFSFQKIFQIGVKGGYLVPLHNNKLKISNINQSIKNAPEIKYPFFIDVFVGIGIFKDKSTEKSSPKNENSDIEHSFE